MVAPVAEPLVAVPPVAFELESAPPVVEHEAANAARHGVKLNAGAVKPDSASLLALPDLVESFSLVAFPVDWVLPPVPATLKTFADE